MLKLSSLARLFYALAITLIGIQFIIYEDFGSHLAPLSLGIPGYNFWMHSLGFLLVICGLGVGLEFKLKLASVILSILLLLILLILHLPRLFSAAKVGGEWADAIEVFALLGGAVLIASNCSVNDAQLRTAIQGQRISARGPLLVGLSLAAFGIRHFIDADEIASQIPGWIPFHIFLTYGIGILFLTFSISILFKVGIFWGGFLMGALFLFLILIFHTPKIYANPRNHYEWTHGFIALAMSGIGFLIADFSKEDYT